MEQGKTRNFTKTYILAIFLGDGFGLYVLGDVNHMGDLVNRHPYFYYFISWLDKCTAT